MDALSGHGLWLETAALCGCSFVYDLSSKTCPKCSRTEAVSLKKLLDRMAVAPRAPRLPGPMFEDLSHA